MSGITYPNESIEYRNARNELLEAELKLRAEIEQVAALRRNLPPGGKLKEDYVFQELVGGKIKDIRLSELFAPGKNTLFMYSLMLSPDMQAPCPMCTSLLDGLNGQVVHILEHINVAVVAKHKLDTIHAHARDRGWPNLSMLSSIHNNYNVDYHGEDKGRQMTIANVFVKEGNIIHHFWGSEMSYAPMIEGGNMRHLDLIWPVWNVLDMTPQGRGQWYPKLSYV